MTSEHGRGVHGHRAERSDPWSEGGAARARRFGPGPFGFGPGPSRGGRMRRGGIRRAVLAALVEGPAHGYEVMQRLEQRTGGMWRPSPGSIYPTLQMLEDEGLVRSTESGGTRTYTLTETGQAEATRAAEHGHWPFDVTGGGATVPPLLEAMGRLEAAVASVARSGNEHHTQTATELLADTTRRLHGLLAEETGARADES